MKTDSDKKSPKKTEAADNNLPKMQSSDAATFLDNTTYETQLKENIIDGGPLQRIIEPINEKSNKTSLPDNLKLGVESLSGYSMDDVKVHYNTAQPAQLNANAYAQGTEIHVATGQENHLPHEAWHVVQQKQGRVQPTMQMKEGIAVNDDDGLEKQADIMGSKAMDL